MSLNLQLLEASAAQGRPLQLIIDYWERKEEYERGRLKNTKDPLKTNKHMREKRRRGQNGGADMSDDDVCGDEVASRRVGRS